MTDEEYENIDRRSGIGHAMAENARLLDPTKRYTSSARDYTEDLTDEDNGCYLHKCGEECNCFFTGHKRRLSICKVCRDAGEEQK